MDIWDVHMLRDDVNTFLKAAADTFSQHFATGTPIHAWALEYQKELERRKRNRLLQIEFEKAHQG